MMKSVADEVKSAILSNMAYKLVSLFVAVVLWVTVIGQKDAIATREFNLDFLMDSKYTIVGDVDRKIRVKVGGPRVALKRLGQIENSIVIDINSLSPGSRMVKIDPNDIQLPLGLKVISIQPSTVKLMIKEVQIINESTQGKEP